MSGIRPTESYFSDFETPGLHIFGPASFPDNNFLFCGGKFIIELENQLKLWEYTDAEQWKTVRNLTLAAVGSHTGPGAWLSLELPLKEARDRLTKAWKQPDLFVFREGSTVKLGVAGVPAADQDHVREALTQKLTEMKYKVADNGTISLVAAVTGPKERTVSYRNSGDYKGQEYFTELHFDYQGKVAWSSSSTNIPGFLMLKPGENIESVLRTASGKPSISFYDGAILPKFLHPLRSLGSRWSTNHRWLTDHHLGVEVRGLGGPGCRRSIRSTGPTFRRLAQYCRITPARTPRISTCWE